MALSIRSARPDDWGAVLHVVEAAFGKASTARFTEELCRLPDFDSELTFVAEVDAEVVGFTMLSRVAVEGRPERLLTLTPMAVRPDVQRRGIGVALVEAAIAAADGRGEPLVLVEGVPAYYPRFGFRSATALGIERPDERIPDDAWMALPLRAYDPAIRGRIVYPDFFPGPPGA